MKNIVIISLLILLGACSASRFDRYPGTKLDAFPQQVQGDYAVPTNTFPFNLFKKDTAIVAIKANGIFPYGDSWNEPMMLSDSVVLSRFGKYYAISQRIENNPPQWNIDVWRVEKNNIHAYYFDNNKNYSSEIAKLLSWTAMAKNANGDWHTFVANEETMLHIMQVNHPDSAVVFTVQDSVLEVITDKYLMKEKAFVLKRVNKKK